MNEQETRDEQNDAFDTEYKDQFSKNSNNYRIGRTVKFAVLFALVLVLGFAGGVRVGATTNSGILTTVISNVPLIGDHLSTATDPALNFSDFWKVYNVLNTKFVQTHASATPATSQSEIYGAIQGLTASYGDPYTVFFPPTQAKVFSDQIAGNFEGVGMEIGVNKENQLTVIAPLKGTPAEKAGILAGDIILSINGKSTEGVSTDEAVKAIRGPKGTTVTFSMYRAGKTISIPVVRNTIQVPTTDNTYDAKTGVYTIALYEFTANSSELFNTAFQAFRASGSKKLIVDLRGNPGGYLDSAVDIASHFLPKGSPVVTEDYKGKQENTTHRSAGYDDLPSGTRVVVLIDQGSASASEILAGALQDNKAATLVGTRSFGKGSVQEVINIGDAALKVTVARWLTPSGRSISDGGLTPDIKVDGLSASSTIATASSTKKTTVPVSTTDTTKKQDPQKDRAVLFLTNGT
jgi:carboxyl-terminal processing protease